MTQRDTSEENVKNARLREDRPPNFLFRIDDMKNVDARVVKCTGNSQETSKFF